MSAASLAMSTGAVDGDAHVGGPQRGRIVDAVAQEADDVPLALQGADHPLLVGGREPGEERGVLRRLGQFGVGHGFHLRAQQHAIGRQPDFLADLAADQLVVAGEDFDRHAVVLQRQDGGGRGILGRIEEGHVAHQHQVAFVVLGIGGLRLDVLVGDRQHAEAVGAEFVAVLLQFRDQQRIDRVDFSLQLEAVAALEHGLRGALADQAADLACGVSTTTDIRLREKSKGISSIFLWSGTACFSWISLNCRIARSRTLRSPVWKWLLR